MAEALKYMYGPPFFEKLCPVLKSTIPQFDHTHFIHSVFDTEWPDLELKQRTRKVTVALHKFLPADFSNAVDYIVQISNTIKTEKTTEAAYPFIFLPDYVELFGLDHFKHSMSAIEQITQLISAEFAIRPFIARYPNETMKQMMKWSKHPSPHVRRLASEGCRPRLPWGMGLPAFKKDPSPILPILENLKCDPSEYVRKSVANNLNDIAKDHPDVVLKIARSWKGASPATDWILKHGSRTLLKKGDETALGINGFNSKIASKVTTLKLEQQKPKIGDALLFSFSVTNNEKKKVKLRIEYAVDYLTSTGKTSKKIFQVSEKEFQPGASHAFTRRLRFADLTTRKHYPGKHTLSIHVNGVRKAATAFTLSK